MNKEEIITYEIANHYISYSESTGDFVWKFRSGDRLKLQSWNSRFSRKKAGSINSDGYITISINYIAVLGHRLAWLIAHKRWPNGMLDHINGIRTDNRICNLREVNHSQNMQNRKVQANNTSGFTGVYWNEKNGNWRSRIKVGGKSIGLGSHKTAELAFMAYKEAKIKYHDIPLLKS